MGQFKNEENSKVKCNHTLDNYLVKYITEVATKKGLSRSALMNMIVTEWYDKESTQK